MWALSQQERAGKRGQVSVWGRGVRRNVHPRGERNAAYEVREGLREGVRLVAGGGAGLGKAVGWP